MWVTEFSPSNPEFIFITSEVLEIENKETGFRNSHYGILKLSWIALHGGIY